MALKAAEQETKSCRTSITLDETVKTEAAAFFKDIGMDMSTGINVILKNMLRTGRFPVSLDVYRQPLLVSEMSAKELERRAQSAVKYRDLMPTAKEQLGYVLSYDTEAGKPVKIYKDGRRELCG